MFLALGRLRYPIPAHLFLLGFGRSCRACCAVARFCGLRLPLQAQPRRGDIRLLKASKIRSATVLARSECEPRAGLPAPAIVPSAPCREHRSVQVTFVNSASGTVQAVQPAEIISMPAVDFRCPIPACRPHCTAPNVLPLDHAASGKGILRAAASSAASRFFGPRISSPAPVESRDAHFCLNN